METAIYKILAKTFGTDKIDFINLKEAPLSLQYQIVKDGIKLIIGDETGRVDFETTVIMKYLDFQPFRQEFYQEYLKTLL